MIITEIILFICMDIISCFEGFYRYIRNKWYRLKIPS